MSSLVSRFPNGVSSASTGVFKNYPYLDETKYIKYFNDFLVYDANEWTVTTTEAGAGSATEAIGTEQGGVLVLTNDAADDDLDSLQLKGESFKFAAGKETFFETRFKISDATQSDLLMGLVITDTTPLTNTDGVYFTKADGSASVSFVVNKDSTATTQAGVATLANDTYVKLGFYYNGSDFAVFLNGAQVATVAATNLPNDEELTVTMHIQNGEAVAKVLTVDYIYVAQER